MLEQSKETYTIKLHCRNCFTSFNKKFPLGFEAEEKGGFSTSTYIDEPGEKYQHVKCPNCGCSNINKVRKVS